MATRLYDLPLDLQVQFECCILVEKREEGCQVSVMVLSHISDSDRTGTDVYQLFEASAGREAHNAIVCHKGNLLRQRNGEFYHRAFCNVY